MSSRRIVVTRSVYDAAHGLLEKTPPDGDGAVFYLANEKMDECHEAGNKEGVRLWRDVWLYLTAAIFMESVVEIIEDAP
jgi:hypothetical protein